MQKISWPNRLTLARILLVGPFVWMLLHLQDPNWHGYARWAALAIFALMAVSDGLDGYLARRLHEESAVGRVLDPLADKLLILASVVLLAREDTSVPGMRLPDIVAIIVISKDIIIVIDLNDELPAGQRAQILHDWQSLAPLTAVKNGRVGVLHGKHFYGAGRRLLRAIDELQAEIERLKP